MAAEKTKAFVLKTMPYRETSGIFYLLTEHQGVLHGIAKGIRKKKTSASFLERGFLIETIVYVKPRRDLHTLGDAHIINYFPNIRKDLVKTALRDAAFESVIASVSVEFPYPELFDLVSRFLVCLEMPGVNTSVPVILWHFYCNFAALLGFGLDYRQCVSCKKDFPSKDAGFLVFEKGGFACERCAGPKDLRNRVPAAVMLALASDDTCYIPAELLTLSASELRRITRLFASYCQYHCENCPENKALEFLDTVLFNSEILSKISAK